MKKCIFCNKKFGGKSTQSSSSKEHVFPQWYLEQYHLRKEQLLVNVQEAVSNTNSELDLLSSLQINEFPTERTLNANNFVHGNVCKRCNNGWMANLEGKMSPKFKELSSTNVNFRNLNSEMRTLLSNWAIKTAMVFNDYKPSDPHHFPQNTYLQMAKGKSKPPNNFHVFLSKVNFIDPLFISNVPSFFVSGEDMENVVKGMKKNVKILFQMQNLVFLVIYWPRKYSTIIYNPSICTPLTKGSHKKKDDSPPDLDPRFIIALDIEFVT